MSSAFNPVVGNPHVFSFPFNSSTVKALGSDKLNLAKRQFSSSIVVLTAVAVATVARHKMVSKLSTFSQIFVYIAHVFRIRFIRFQTSPQNDVF